MSRRGRMLLTAGAIALAVLLWSRQTLEPLSYYSSASYVQRTNALIRRGALNIDSRCQDLALTESATEAEREWFAASYLQNDVELFNRNRELFGHFFVVEDCKLREINPFLRTIRLPFVKTMQWMGNIEYSGPGSDATLLSANGRNIAITRTPSGVLPRDGRTIAGEAESLSANVAHVDFAGGGRTPGVEVHSVEGTAILEQRVKRGQPADVRLLGNALNEGRITRLASGDWLHLSSTSPAAASETFQYSSERRYERLSVMRTRNAMQERAFMEEDPLLQWVGGDDGDEMLTFGEALARSVTNALQQIDKAHAAKLWAGFDLQLSIDRSLQSRLDAALAANARRLMNDLSSGDPFAASVTVMNGKTGEILAAASFPGQSDLEGMSGVSDEEQRRLLVNHNFKRHPIGSVGKPFFYAAAVTRHPFLFDLTVAPHAPAERPDGGDGEREVLQFFIRDYKLWPHADVPTDLLLAIERSCNKFTIELATLALAAPRDLRERTLSRPVSQIFARQPDVAWPGPGSPGDGPRIGGQAIDFPIALGVYMKDDGKPVPTRELTTAVVTPGTLDRIDEAPFIEAFGDLTGVRTYGGVDAPKLPAQGSGNAAVTLNYDLRPWAKLLTPLMEGETDERAWKVRAALQSVSPERVNLSLNQVTDFRTEFVSLLLGGSTSRWTNVQLAEALSRLVTGRQVEASMVHAVRPRGTPSAEVVAPLVPPLPPPLSEQSLSAEARETVLRGMKRVILGAQGTAKPMTSRVRELEERFPGFRVAVFSKTGSPTVERPESKPAGRLLLQLVRTGTLHYDGRRLVAGNTPYAARGTRERQQFIDALRRVSPGAAPRTVSRIAAYADRFERYRAQLVFVSPADVRLTESAASPIHVVAGALTLNRDHSIFDSTRQADSSAAYALSIVKWRGTGEVPTREELDHPDARVITAVFYLDIGPGSAVAVDAARAMMPELAKLLE